MYSASIIKMEFIALMMKAVYFYETTRHHFREGCHLHIRRCENLKSDPFFSSSGLSNFLIPWGQGQFFLFLEPTAKKPHHGTVFENE
jgi:hypothetical protein